MGGERPAGFTDQVRVRDTLAVTLGLQHMHHIVGVFEYAVVHGAATAGTGSFVVDTQAAADIDGTDGGAHSVQFRVEASALTQAGLDVPDIRNL